ncbi:MAG TPA: LCP family protein [Solirubrobacterales bacterium]|jgi:LCP family protein required for cell wall assembly
MSSEALPPRNPAWTRKPPPEGDGTEPPKKKRYWWKFTLAAVLIVAVSAGATASSVLLFLNDIVNELQHNSGQLPSEVETLLKKVHGGEPQTILILGSDKRAGVEFAEEKYGRSDTAMLLRLDPEKGLISVLSIPRDLKVEIPGVGIDKFNAAYSYGGPRLTLRVVKELTGLEPSHVVNIDFLGFVRAVDAIGCVYVDVDRRYYHSNVGVPPSEEYSEINIQPGYQKLCGKKALEYVRYRHTDTDIVRSARQQDFISQARRQVGLGALLQDQEHLAKIFTEYTTSDITSLKTLLQLIDLVIESRGSELNQVHFPAELGPSYVYASRSAIRHAAKEFMGETGADSGGFPEKKPNKDKTHKQGKGSKGKKAEKQTAKPKAEKTKKKAEYSTTGSDELVPASEAGHDEGKIVARHVGGGFPVYYPSRLPPGAAFVESDPYEHVVDPRVYHLRDKEKVRHPAYRMVGVYQPEYEVTYFGIQGIRGWEDPPILDDPSETKKIHGREYDIYVESGKVTMVAWHRGEDTYWVSNSLQDSLTNDQMIGIARSAKLILPKRKNPKNGGKKR